MNIYDVAHLHRIMVLTFCNEIKHADPFAFLCIDEYIANDILHNTLNIENWQAYTMHYALPYEKGKMDY